MEQKITADFLDGLFPPERTDAFFDALFGGAEEGAYTIVLRPRAESETSVEVAMELHQRPGKCLMCSLTYGLFPKYSGVTPSSMRKALPRA